MPELGIKIKAAPHPNIALIIDVVQANSTMSAVAKELDASRAGLYKALSAEGNPELKTLVAVLDTVGLQLSVTPKRELPQAA